MIASSSKEVTRAFCSLVADTMFIGHITACMWFWIAMQEGFGDASWTTLYEVNDSSLWTQYLSAICTLLAASTQSLAFSCLPTNVMSCAATHTMLCVGLQIGQVKR